MFVKKLLSMLISALLLAMVILPGAASAASSLYTRGVDAALDSFFEIKYSRIAGLKESSEVVYPMPENGDKQIADFITMENCLNDAFVIGAHIFADELIYKDFDLEKHYSIKLLDETHAEAEAFVLCSFNYESTPDIDSSNWFTYHVELKKNGGEWGIISRTYPDFYEELFWAGNLPSVEFALEKLSETKKNARTTAPDGAVYANKAEKQLPERIAPLPYNRTGAANTAKNYVEPVSGTTSYTYPSNYHQRSSDCTNFVSFCMNYGGGIPQDYDGIYQWHTGASTSNDTMSWINVDYFYSYLMLGYYEHSGTGIVASCSYSGSTYPGSYYINGLHLGDIVQFSSNGGGSDWTHSVIISTKTSTQTLICGHSAAGGYYDDGHYVNGYKECSLLAFFNCYSEHNNNNYYIRLIIISGYNEW